MATSPKAPTARKSLPQTTTAAAPGSQGGTINDQRRKSSTTSQSSQQRKTSTVSQSSQQRKASRESRGAPMAGSKRKAKAETPAASKGKKAGVAVAQMVPPPKKRKGAEETNDADQAAAPSPPTQTQAKSPAQTLPSTFTPAHYADMQDASHMAKKLLIHAIQANPAILPPNSPNAVATITSAQIDIVAHTMWQIAFKHGLMLQQGCNYGAMFSQLKLAALAKLNFLPSWWFFREMAVAMLKEELGYIVDDEVMDAEWRTACHWCRGVIDTQARIGGNGGGNVGEGTDEEDAEDE